MYIGITGLEPGAMSTAAGILMLIKSQEQASQSVAFIGKMQDHMLKIHGEEISKLFNTKDVTALSKTINSKVGQVVDLVA